MVRGAGSGPGVSRASGLPFRRCVLVAAVAATGVALSACGSSAAPPTTTASVSARWAAGVLSLEKGMAGYANGASNYSALKPTCQQTLSEAQKLQLLPAPPGLLSGGYQELQTALTYFQTGASECIQVVNDGDIESIAMAGDDYNSGKVTIVTLTDSDLANVWLIAAGQSPVPTYTNTSPSSSPNPSTGTTSPATGTSPSGSLASPSLLLCRSSWTASTSIHHPSPLPIRHRWRRTVVEVNQTLCNI